MPWTPCVYKTIALLNRQTVSFRGVKAFFLKTAHAKLCLTVNESPEICNMVREALKHMKYERHFVYVHEPLKSRE